MNNKQTISYIFPVHNESKFLKKQITLFIKEVEKNKLPFDELILVENGSTDKSWKICITLEKFDKRIVAKRINIASYGLAVKHGMLSAQSNILVLLNVDFFDINFIKQAIPLIKKHDIVNSSKLHKVSIDNRKTTEKIRTKFFNSILKKIFKYPGTDTHGIKVFKNNKKLQNTLQQIITKHELFDTELLIRIKNSVTELPVTLNHVRPSRYTSFKRIKKLTEDLTRITLYLLFSKKTQINQQIKVADDYGINPITSKAIIDLFIKKRIDVVSVLPNMVTTKEVKLLKKVAKDEQIAIHVNLVRGKPVSDNKKIKTLINKDGNFYSLPIFLLKLAFKQISLDEIQIEMENQIKKLKKMEIQPKYLNSEQHTHIFFPLLQINKRLAKKYSIKNIRNFEEIKYYLSWKIHKYIVLVTFNYILNIIYKEKIINKTKQNKKIEIIKEKILHPGSNYD